jgi:DNA-binding response OmpR family regulator
MYVIEKEKILKRSGISTQSKGEMPQLCIITERECSVGKLAINYLAHEGFPVRVLSLRDDVIQRMEQLRPTLVMIQTTMAREAAIDLCLGIRRGRMPVIFLSANASEEERILGLEAGADDYITESSTGREIVARVRAVIRRVARQEGMIGSVCYRHSAMLPNKRSIPR